MTNTKKHVSQIPECIDVRVENDGKTRTIRGHYGGTLVIADNWSDFSDQLMQLSGGEPVEVQS